MVVLTQIVYYILIFIGVFLILHFSIQALAEWLDRRIHPRTKPSFSDYRKIEWSIFPAHKKQPRYRRNALRQGSMHFALHHPSPKRLKDIVTTWWDMAEKWPEEENRLLALMDRLGLDENIADCDGVVENAAGRYLSSPLLGNDFTESKARKVLGHLMATDILVTAWSGGVFITVVFCNRRTHGLGLI